MTGENSSQKTIHINPEFLKFTNHGKTRKKISTKPIKFKSAKTDNHTKTTKRKLLNYLRSKKAADYREMSKLAEKPVNLSDTQDVLPKSDFEESLAFLENIAKNPKNTTLKYRPPIDFQSSNTSEWHCNTNRNKTVPFLHPTILC